MLKAVSQKCQPAAKNTGFSVLEVMVAAVIFIVAAAGVLSSLSVLRPKGRTSSKRLEAAYVGKGVIDKLRAQVDAGTWDTGDLRTGVMHSQTLGGYTVNYYLVDVPAGCTPGVDCSARKMFMNVYYTE